MTCCGMLLLLGFPFKESVSSSEISMTEKSVYCKLLHLNQGGVLFLKRMDK